MGKVDNTAASEMKPVVEQNEGMALRRVSLSGATAPRRQNRTRSNMMDNGGVNWLPGDPGRRRIKRGSACRS